MLCQKRSVNRLTIIGRIWSLSGWVSEQPGLLEGVPPWHGVCKRCSLTSFPTQTILWFHESLSICIFIWILVYGLADLQLTQPILLLTPASFATFTDTLQWLQCIFALLKCTRSRKLFLCHLKYTCWLNARSRQNSKRHYIDLLETYLLKMFRIKSFKFLGKLMSCISSLSQSAL